MEVNANQDSNSSKTTLKGDFLLDENIITGEGILVIHSNGSRYHVAD